MMQTRLLPPGCGLQGMRRAQSVGRAAPHIQEPAEGNRTLHNVIDCHWPDQLLLTYPVQACADGATIVQSGGAPEEARLHPRPGVRRIIPRPFGKHALLGIWGGALLPFSIPSIKTRAGYSSFTPGKRRTTSRRSSRV